ncbi:MAG: peptidoglycan-binding protein [Candidatus Omnitrophica bacterium]|nr:peptidoglycan-binding protein [Candidatus Omnitrophota bacterium]
MKTIVNISLKTAIIATLFFNCGCDIFYRWVDKPGAEEKDLVGELIPFESNPTVEEIQALLKLYGYSPGKADGIMGPSTREAIAKFQMDQGLEVTRTVDSLTWEKLEYFVKKGLVSAEGLNVRLVQQLLFENGYPLDKIDGKIGPRTTQAIIAFQKKNSLKPDGKIGYKTLQRLAAILP